MKANVTVQLVIDTANYEGYADSPEGVKNIVEDGLVGVVIIKEDPTIVVTPISSEAQ